MTKIDKGFMALATAVIKRAVIDDDWYFFYHDNYKQIREMYCELAQISVDDAQKMLTESRKAKAKKREEDLYFRRLAQRTGISTSILRYRIKNKGMTEQEAITKDSYTPPSLLKKLHLT
jgi:hypothetical protein